MGNRKKDFRPAAFWHSAESIGQKPQGNSFFIELFTFHYQRLLTRFILKRAVEPQKAHRTQKNQNLC
jgi:hypothetical protein